MPGPGSGTRVGTPPPPPLDPLRRAGTPPMPEDVFPSRGARLRKLWRRVPRPNYRSLWFISAAAIAVGVLISIGIWTAPKLYRSVERYVAQRTAIAPPPSAEQSRPTSSSGDSTASTPSALPAVASAPTQLLGSPSRLSLREQLEAKEAERSRLAEELARLKQKFADLEAERNGWYDESREAIRQWEVNAATLKAAHDSCLRSKAEELEALKEECRGAISQWQASLGR